MNNNLSEKPKLLKKEQEGHIAKTIFSIVLFALTFSLLLNDYQIIGLLIIVLLLHELGHFFFMKQFGYTKLQMYFIPFLGAMVQGEKQIYSQKESTFMLLAGPIPGIIIGFILLNYGINEEYNFILQLSVLLIFLNILNLLPVSPLDGGQVVKILFFYKKPIVELIINVFVSIAFVALGLWLNIWLLTIFGVLFIVKIKNLHKSILIRKDLYKQQINFEVNYDDLSLEAFNNIKNIVEKHEPMLNTIKSDVDENKYNNILAKQVESVLLTPLKRDANIYFKTVVILLFLFAFHLTINLFLQLDLNTIINAF